MFGHFTHLTAKILPADTETAGRISKEEFIDIFKIYGLVGIDFRETYGYVYYK